MQFLEPALQRALALELGSRGIAFMSDENGAIWYRAEDDGLIRQIRIGLLDFWFERDAILITDERYAKIFRDELAARKVDYVTETLPKGERFIWQASDGDRVQEVLLRARSRYAREVLGVDLR